MSRALGFGYWFLGFGCWAVGNIIARNSASDSDCLEMSNGATGALLDALLVSGTPKVKTEWQRKLVTYLAWKDQNIFGNGTVSFDLGEMPFDAERIESQKTFLLEVIDGALKYDGRQFLNYEPNEPYFSERLRKLRDLIDKFCVSDITNDTDTNERREATTVDHGVCEKHQIFKHEYGCMLCV